MFLPVLLSHGNVSDCLPCSQINERLAPIKEANPKASWRDWVTAAYFGRISLSAAGFYKVCFLVLQRAITSVVLTGAALLDRRQT